MAIYSINLLYCDGPLCATREQSPLNEDNDDISRTRKGLIDWAKREGWKRSRGKDYCAECQQAMKVAT